MPVASAPVITFLQLDLAPVISHPAPLARIIYVAPLHANYVLLGGSILLMRT
jgi:hypothetical protein